MKRVVSNYIRDGGYSVKIIENDEILSEKIFFTRMIKIKNGGLIFELLSPFDISVVDAEFARRSMCDSWYCNISFNYF